MLDRLGWIAAAGAALIAGIAWNDGFNITVGDDHGAKAAERAARDAQVEATILKSRDEQGRPIVISDTVVAGNSPEGRAIAAAAAAVVRAEVRLAKLDVMGKADAQALAEARAESDRARAELDRLTTAYEARHKGAGRHELRDAIKTEIREAMR